MCEELIIIYFNIIMNYQRNRMCLTVELLCRFLFQIFDKVFPDTYFLDGLCDFVSTSKRGICSTCVFQCPKCDMCVTDTPYTWPLSSRGILSDRVNGVNEIDIRAISLKFATASAFHQRSWHNKHRVVLFQNSANCTDHESRHLVNGFLLSYFPHAPEISSQRDVGEHYTPFHCRWHQLPNPVELTRIRISWKIYPSILFIIRFSHEWFPPSPPPELK